MSKVTGARQTPAMSSHRIGLSFVGVLLLGSACGHSGPPAPPAPDVAAPVASEPADVAAPVAPEPDAGPTAAPQPVDAAAAPAPSEAADVVDGGAASPPSPAMAAAVASGAVGCVAVGAKGGAIVIHELVESSAPVARELLWTRDPEHPLELATCGGPDAPKDAATCEGVYRAAGAALAWSEVAGLVDAPLAPCVQGRPIGSAASVIVGGEPVRAAIDRHAVVVRRGKVEVRRGLPEGGDMGAPDLRYRLVTLFAGPASVGVVVDIDQAEADGDGPPRWTSKETRTFEVTAFELGLAPCVPAPTGAPAPASSPPAFEPWAKDGCLAMTADGTKAAFLLHDDYEHPFEESPTRHESEVRWVGPGKAPALDLGCVAKKACAPADLERLGAAAKKLGLVGCPETAADTEGNVVIGGVALTLFANGQRGATVDLGDGFTRWLGTFPARSGDEGLVPTTVHQIAGGPIYVAWERQDSISKTTGVEVYPLSALPLCPAGTAPAPLVAPAEPPAPPPSPAPK